MYTKKKINRYLNVETKTKITSRYERFKFVYISKIIENKKPTVTSFVKQLVMSRDIKK